MTVGKLKDASIEFTVPNESGDTSFSMLQGLWSSVTPCDVSIFDTGGALRMNCEVMNFNVNQNLQEVVSANVRLEPMQSSTGGGMIVGRESRFVSSSRETHLRVLVVATV